MTSSEPKSWAEMVQGIDHARKNLPWDSNSFEPVKRVSTFERKRFEREFDPVSMTYNNPAKEASFQAKQTNRLEFLKTNYNNLTNNIFPSATTSFFGIANPAPPCSGAPYYTTGKHHTHPYNILTNYNNDHHESAPFQFDEKYYLKYNKQVLAKAAAAAAETSNSSAPASHSRSFNIVSNKEKNKKNEELLAEKTKQINQILLKKYYEKNNYNAILNKFTSDENEQKAVEAERQQKLMKSLRQKNSKTVSNKIAEGSIYNIINNTDKLVSGYDLYRSYGLFDEDGEGSAEGGKNDFEMSLLKQSVLYNKASSSVANRGLNKIKKMPQTNNIILSEDDLRQSASLSTTQGSTQRRREMKDHTQGFNIVNNQDVERPPTINRQWESLKGTAPVNFSADPELKFDKTYCSLDLVQQPNPSQTVSSHAQPRTSSNNNSSRASLTQAPSADLSSGRAPVQSSGSKPVSRCGSVPTLDLSKTLGDSPSPMPSTSKSQFSVRTGGFH